LTQSLFVFLRLAWSKTSKLAVTFTSKLKSLLSRSETLLMKLSPLARKLKDFGVHCVNYLAVVPSLKLQSLWQRLKSLTTLLLTKPQVKADIVKNLSEFFKLQEQLEAHIRESEEKARTVVSLMM
jgi:hypothetical protein